MHNDPFYLKLENQLNFLYQIFRLLSEKSEDELDEMCRMYSLPGDFLQLKQLQVPSEQQDAGTDTDTAAIQCQYTVHSALPLPLGSSFGPFKVTLLSEDKEEEADHPCILKVRKMVKKQQ